MKLVFIIFSLLAFPILGNSTPAQAGGSCTVCMDAVSGEDLAEHKASSCSNHHCIDKGCLADQVKALESVADLEIKGLPCCGENCAERIPFATVRELLDPADRAALDSRIENAARATDVSIAKAEVQRLSQGFEDAFVLCCPIDGCGGGLDEIQGCNAAKCSNEACKATFCYLCLKQQENSQIAHAHVREHSGDYWDYRPGYIARYQWILARKSLAHLFKRKVDQAVRASALKSRKAMLQEKNMWPMPAGVMTNLWIAEVRKADLAPDKAVELLQNEYIYRLKRKDSANASIVAAELRRLGAPVLASLDLRGANAGQQAAGRAEVQDKKFPMRVLVSPFKVIRSFP